MQAERALQQAVTLRDEGDLPAQALRVPTVERLAVDEYPAARGHVEPGADGAVLTVQKAE